MAGHRRAPPGFRLGQTCPTPPVPSTPVDLPWTRLASDARRGKLGKVLWNPIIFMENPMKSYDFHGKPYEILLFSWKTLWNPIIFMENPMKSYYFHGKSYEILLFSWKILLNGWFIMENPIRMNDIGVPTPFMENNIVPWNSLGSRFWLQLWPGYMNMICGLLEANCIPKKTLKNGKRIMPR